MSRSYRRSPPIDPLADNPTYECIKFLGSGSFGTVYKARKRDANEDGSRPEVAIKLLGVGKKRIDKHVENELILQSRCWHPHVVTVKDVFLLPEDLAAVMELVPGGDLFALVKQSGYGLEEAKARWIFQQIVMGVDYLHQLGIAQRDIKLENILVSNPESDWPNVKISDFGFSKSDEQSRCNTEAGTRAYMAPEVYRGAHSENGYCGMKADMWSCGVMLFVMLFCKYPFNVDGEERNKHTAAQEIGRLMRAEIVVPDRPRVSRDCIDFVRHLIVASPEARYTAPDCLKHKWFQQGLPPNALAMNTEFLAKTKQRLSAKRERDIRSIVAAARGDKPSRLSSSRRILDSLLGHTAAAKAA